MSQPKLARMAWRNLWRNRRRTLVTLASIAFGILLAVLFTAMQDRSFADMIDTAARMGTGHVTLQHPDYLKTPKLNLTLGQVPELREKALADPDVERVVPRISGQTMLSTARASFGAYFIAYDPTLEDAQSFMYSEGLVEGEMLDSTTGRAIVLGTTLAKNLDLELGDKVVYRVMGKDGEMTAGLARLKGTVSTGAPSADAALCLLPIDTVRKVLGYDPEESTHLALFLNDSRQSADVVERLAPDFGDHVSILAWDDVRPELSGFIAMKVGGAIFMELVILLLIAASIFNTLFVSVMERLREFGIMIAIGYSTAQIFILVMWESVFLALSGLVAGALITLGPYLYLHETGIDLTAMMGENSAEVAGVGFDPILKVGIFPENVLYIAIAITLATLAAGLYPAWKAGSVEPVDSIKLV